MSDATEVARIVAAHNALIGYGPGRQTEHASPLDLYRDAQKESAKRIFKAQS